MSGGVQTVEMADAADPFVVQIVDAADDPVAGVIVDWTIVSGGGSLSTTSTVTGADGRSSVVWTAPAATGSATIRASVDGLDPVTFNVTVMNGTVPVPASFSIVSGDGQAADTSTELSPFVVNVRDQDGDPIEDVPVFWSIDAGGGSLEATSSLTDGNGNAQVVYTTGTDLGSAMVRAAVAGLTPLTFQMNVVP